jgi:hypothetical protein
MYKHQQTMNRDKLAEIVAALYVNTSERFCNGKDWCIKANKKQHPLPTVRETAQTRQIARNQCKPYPAI